MSYNDRFTSAQFQGATAPTHSQEAGGLYTRRRYNSYPNPIQNQTYSVQDEAEAIFSNNVASELAPRTRTAMPSFRNEMNAIYQPVTNILIDGTGTETEGGEDDGDTGGSGVGGGNVTDVIISGGYIVVQYADATADKNLIPLNP